MIGVVSYSAVYDFSEEQMELNEQVCISPRARVNLPYPPVAGFDIPGELLASIERLFDDEEEEELPAGT
jgi:hypothetical protein